jgi:hypothetical protein
MKRIAALLLASLFSAAYAQSPWQGEWGQVDPQSVTVGSRLTISDCSDQSCRFFLTVASGCSSSGSSTDDNAPRLHLLSPTDAAITLPAGDPGKSCTLNMHRNTAPAGIAVTSSGNGCAYYCTSTPTFNAMLPFQSATVFNGMHKNECFLHKSPAAAATCADPALAKLEQQWMDLFGDYPLDHPDTPNDSSYNHDQAVDATILKTCDAAASPAQCLHDRFTADIATMQAKKSAVQSASTERGDPATGHALALKIAGRYRHSFANGDVQGDHYRSTDTLTITPVGAASIHFDVALNFYNGHTCSLSGGALFRKDGTFVFDDDPANALPPEPTCRLAIIPAADGIGFKDLNGACREYCGARGNWDGAGFTFAQRVQPKK